MTSTATGATMRWQGMQTWYRLVGDLHRADVAAPVVICHGGPGLTHDYLAPVAELARSGRPFVLYDQFGSGRSGHRCDAPADFWTVELFVRELELLIEHLGLHRGYHLVGHSWGGMLALEHAVRRPDGLRSVVVADAFASSATYLAEVGRLVGGLPPEVRDAIERHERAGTTGSAEHQEAIREFYARHVCRTWPLPDGLRRTLAALGDDPTVYRTMCGSSELSLSGSLRDWEITDRLGSVDVPVLLVSGRYDEVTPAAVEELHRGLPDASWVLFEESSHMPHIEEPERFLDVVEQFLDSAGA